MPNDTIIERATAAIQAAHSAMTPADYADIEAIAAEAADMRTAKPEEALLQACILTGSLACMETKNAAHQVELEKLERLAGSLVAYIERTAGLDRKTFGLDFYC